MLVLQHIKLGVLLRGPAGGQGLSRDRASAHGGRVIIVAASVRSGAAGAELHEARDPGVPGVLALALQALLAVVPLKVTLRPLKVTLGPL